MPPDAFDTPFRFRIRARDRVRHEGRNDINLLIPKIGSDEIESQHPAMGLYPAKELCVLPIEIDSNQTYLPRMDQSLLQSSLPFPVRRGKVRDVYDLGGEILFIATDRISAFDCVMPNGIPDKGKILTALSLFWFEKFKGRFENHLITANVAEYPVA